MKRVAIIESIKGIGGAEINLLRLAKPFQAHGWEPVFLVPGEGTLTRELEQRGIAWRMYSDLSFKSTSRYWGKLRLADPSAILYDLIVVFQYARSIQRVLNQEHIDLVHTNAIPSHLSGGLAARWSNLPCVWHMQDIVNPKSGFRLFNRVLNFAANILADRIICISKAVAQQFGTHAQRKVHVIYNGVDTQSFKPSGTQPFREQWLGDGYKYLVGQVSRITPWKGQEMLLRVARHAKDENLPVRFIFVGDDSEGHQGYRQELITRVRELVLEDRVIFAGWLSDMPGVMRSLDMVIHPTLEPEPFGLVVAEAMACAKPVIVSNHGGAAEVVGSSGAGIRVAPRDAAAFFDALKFVLNNPDKSAQMGAYARERIEANFSFSQFTSKMVALFDSVLAGERVN
jgi:glycosyltransferase involved in cell wall biosynthesis